MKKPILNKNKVVVSFLLFAVVVANLAFIPKVLATTFFTKSTIQELVSMNAAATSSLRVIFKTSSAGDASGTLTVDFNGADATTWTGSSGAVGTSGSQTVSSAACAAPTGATALPGTLTVASTSHTITVSGVTTLTASTSYCVDLTYASAVTNPTAGVYHPTITSSGGDTTTVAMDIISNDQIVVSAVVPPTFTLALSGNTDAFTTNLATGSVTGTTGVTATVNTNAQSGYFLWAYDSNTGLHSASQSYTIASTSPGSGSVQTLTAGTEGYVFGVTSITQGTGAGTTSAATQFNSTSSGKGDGLNGTNAQFASSTGTANGAVLTLKEYAAISGTTPAAGDYSDTITIIGAGSF